MIRCLILLAFSICINFANGQKKVQPQKGEGIDALLKRYGYKDATSRTVFVNINKGKFTKSGGLILGQTYTLPENTNNETTEINASRVTHTESLFGAAQGTVPITNHELEGACLYIVSGHGGPDPGAISIMNGHELHEDEYAYDISLRLARLLIQHGAKVEIIIQDAKDGIRDATYLSNSNRETCRGQSIPLDQKARLRQRTEAVNSLSYHEKSKYKRAIFIHIDSRSRREQIDVFFYHAPGSKYGKRLADNIRNTFERKYAAHQPGRGFNGTVSERNLFVLNHTQPVATFLELGNMQNERDRKRIVMSSNRQALAEWICQGIIRDYQQ